MAASAEKNACSKAKGIFTTKIKILLTHISGGNCGEEVLTKMRAEMLGAFDQGGSAH